MAIVIAFVIAAAGGLAAAGKWRIASTEKIESDRARAVNLPLDELVALTRAKEPPCAAEGGAVALVRGLVRMCAASGRPMTAS